jgi:hypothetical protein
LSNRCTGAVFDRYPVGGGEFALALSLADNAHDDGTNIFISVPSMAAKSRQSIRSVQAHLRTMLDTGWLSITERGGGSGKFTRYRINPAWLKGAEIAGFSDRANGANSAGFPDQKRVQNDAQKGAEHDSAYKNRKNPNTPLPPTGGAPGETTNAENRGFESIAAEYPRRAGIAAARRVWEALNPGAELQNEIARAIQAWIPSAEWQRESGRYVPKLGRFLRDKRWLDAPYPASPPPAVVLPPRPTAAEIERNRVMAREHLAKARALTRAASDRRAQPVAAEGTVTP